MLRFVCDITISYASGPVMIYCVVMWCTKYVTFCKDTLCNRMLKLHKNCLGHRKPPRKTRVVAVLPGIGKKQLYCLPKSQNNCTKKFSLIGSFATYDEAQLAGVRPSWPTQCVVLTVGNLPPSCFYLCYMSRELYILSAEEQYWLLRNKSLVYSVAVTLSCDTLVLTSSSSFSSSTSFPFLFLPWERVGWFFLGCHDASFLTRSLGFIKLFSYSPLMSLTTSHQVQPPAWPSPVPSDLSRLEPNAPTWVRLVLSTFVRLFWDPASQVTVPRTIWSEWTQSEQSPWFAVRSPLSVSLGRLTYIVIVHLLYILTFDSFQFSFLHSIKSSAWMFCFS